MFGFPHHIDLTVQDLEVSVPFYGIVLNRLGYRRTGVYAGTSPCWAYVAAEAPDFSIALHQAVSVGEHDRYVPGLHHLAFHAQTRQEVVSFFEFLLDNDITVLDPPAEYDYTQGYYAVFFADPDGIKLEVVYEPNATPITGQQKDQTVAE